MQLQNSLHFGIYFLAEFSDTGYVTRPKSIITLPE